MTRIKSTIDNKPVAIMAADVNALTPVLRKNVSDYPSILHWMPPQFQSAKRCVTLYTKPYYVSGIKI